MAAILKSVCVGKTCRFREIHEASWRLHDLPKPRGNVCSTASRFLPSLKFPSVCIPSVPRKDSFDCLHSRRCSSRDKPWSIPGSLSLSYFVLSLLAVSATCYPNDEQVKSRVRVAP